MNEPGTTLAARLAAYEALNTPLWIFEIDLSRMVWCNSGGRALRGNRDPRPGAHAAAETSEATRSRIKRYLGAFKQGRKVVESWTFYPGGKPRLVRCACSGITLDDGRLAMLVEGSTRDSSDPLAGSDALRHTSVMVSLYSRDGRLLGRNPAALDCFPREEQDFLEHFAAADDGITLLKTLQKGAGCRTEVQVRTAAGARWHEVDIRGARDPIGQEPQILVTEVDVTERRAAEQELRQLRHELEHRVLERSRALEQMNAQLREEVTERRLVDALAEQSVREHQVLLENSVVGICYVKGGRITRCNRRLEEIFGYGEEGLVGHPSSELFGSPEDAARMREQARPEVASGGAFRTDWRLRHRDGTPIWCSINGRRLDPADPAPGSVWIIETIEDRKQAEEALERARESLEAQAEASARELTSALQTVNADEGTAPLSQERIRLLALHDPGTGLANRVAFEDHLGLALAQAQRGGRRVGVLAIHLEAAGGGRAAERLIQDRGERLVDVMREGDTVARTGTTTLGVLLPDLAIRRHAGEVADKIRAALGTGAGACRIGISLFPDHGSDPHTLMRQAADAAAQAGGAAGPVRFYAPRQAGGGRRQSAEAAFRRALQQGELVLHFQPRIEIASARINGLEALVRWERPGRGLVGPVEFLAVAEATGLIIPMGEWVLMEACRLNRRWQEEGCVEAPVAVNLSARQLDGEHLTQAVETALRASGLEPRHLELELTEQGLGEAPEDALRVIERLHALGVGVSIDDFGTGQGSLSALNRLPVDRIKIDRSIVRGVADDPDDQTVARTLLTLARGINLAVSAEGVENPKQLTWLGQHGCDEYQGFYCSKPLPPKQIQRLLQGRTRLAETKVS